MAEGNANAKPGRRIAKQFLAPIIATAASAAASYFAKKAPGYFEEKVLPKLRDAAGGASDTARNLPDRAKSAAGTIGGVAEDLTERAKSVGSHGNGNDGGASTGRSRSPEELEQRRAARAEAREARRKAAKR